MSGVGWLADSAPTSMESFTPGARSAASKKCARRNPARSALLRQVLMAVSRETRCSLAGSFAFPPTDCWAVRRERST